MRYDARFRKNARQLTNIPMQNFVFQNPTKIVFGKDVADSVGQETAKYAKKILLHYGSDRIKFS